MCGNAATEAHNSLTKVQFVVESVKRTSNIENGNGMKMEMTVVAEEKA